MADNEPIDETIASMRMSRNNTGIDIPSRAAGEARLPLQLFQEK